MRLIKLSNQIFTLGLSHNALCIYSYLCSFSRKVMADGSAAVKVKQTTIAAACGIKSVQTVAKALRELETKQLVNRTIRTIREDRKLSTNLYFIKKQSVSNCFFFVCPKMAFSGNLCPRQLVAYLFLCKAHSVRLGRSWNSYNDMAKQIGMKRETVIATINELCCMHLIYKQCRFSKMNSRLHIDNLYFIVQRQQGRIKKKKPCTQHGFSRWLTEAVRSTVKRITASVYHNTEKLSSFFSGRGSPENESLILDPNITSVKKRKIHVIP